MIALLVIVNVIPTQTHVTSQTKIDLPIGGMFAINNGTNLGNIDRVSAFNLAIYEINSNPNILPGYNLVGIPVDSQSDPEIAKVELQNLINQNIAALIGPSLSRVAEVIAKNSDLPMISPSATSVLLSDKDQFPNFILMTTSDRFQRIALLDIVAHFDWPLISIVTSKDSYGQGNVNPILNSKSGTSVGVSTYQDLAQDLKIVIDKTILLEQGKSDIRKELQKIKDGKSKVILINLIATDAIPVLETAYDLGLTAENGYVWIGSDGVMQREIINQNQAVNQVSQGMIGLNPKPVETANYVKFLDTWENCGGQSSSQYPGCGDRNPNIYAPFTYDSVYFLAYALDTMVRDGLDIFDHQLLVEQLYKTQIQGATGDLQIDDFGDRTGSYSLMNVQGDGITRVGEWKVETGLDISGTIIWNGNVLRPSTEVPRGVKGILDFTDYLFFGLFIQIIMRKYKEKKSPKSIM